MTFYTEALQRYNSVTMEQRHSELPFYVKLKCHTNLAKTLLKLTNKTSDKQTHIHKERHCNFHSSPDAVYCDETPGTRKLQSFPCLRHKGVLGQ